MSCVYKSDPIREISCSLFDTQLVCKCPLMVNVDQINYQYNMSWQMKINATMNEKNRLGISEEIVKAEYGIDIRTKCQQLTQSCHRFSADDASCQLRLDFAFNELTQQLQSLIRNCNLQECWIQRDQPFDCTVFRQKTKLEYFIVGTTAPNLMNIIDPEGIQSRKHYIGLAIVPIAVVNLFGCIIFCFKKYAAPRAYGTLGFVAGSGLAAAGFIPFIFNFASRSEYKIDLISSSYVDARCVYNSLSTGVPLCYYLPACTTGDFVCTKLQLLQATEPRFSCNCPISISAQQSSAKFTIENTTLRVKVPTFSSNSRVPDNDIVPSRALAMYGVNSLDVCRAAEEVECNRYGCTPKDSCCLNLIEPKRTDLSVFCSRSQACYAQALVPFECSYANHADGDTLYGYNTALMLKYLERWLDDNPPPFYYVYMAVIGTIVALTGIAICIQKPIKQKVRKTFPWTP